MNLGERIAVIGAGQIGEALIRGLVQSQCVRPDLIVASDPRPERLSLLHEAYKIETTTDNLAAVSGSATLILAVKPKLVAPVLNSLKEVITRGKPRVVSLAAGASTTTIEQTLGDTPRVVRAMPNTPVLVQAGATVLCAGRYATDEDLSAAQVLFESVGVVVRLPEAAFDAVTGLSGSGPAYVFVMLEAMIDAGVHAGLDRDVARQLATQTVLGAATLVRDTGQHPAVLRDQVASPAGTTIAGLRALQKSGFSNAIADAIDAAIQRASELGR